MVKNVNLGPIGIWTQDLWFGSWHIILYNCTTLLKIKTGMSHTCIRPQIMIFIYKLNMHCKMLFDFKTALWWKNPFAVQLQSYSQKFLAKVVLAWIWSFSKSISHICENVLKRINGIAKKHDAWCLYIHMMYKIIMYIQWVHVIYSTLMYFFYTHVYFNDVHRYEI